MAEMGRDVYLVQHLESRRTLAHRTALIPKRAFKRGGPADRASASRSGTALEEVSAKTWLACRVGTCEPRKRTQGRRMPILGGVAWEKEPPTILRRRSIFVVVISPSLVIGALQGCIGYNMGGGVRV